MNFDLVEESTFYAPVSSDTIDMLLGQYATQRKYIADIDAALNQSDGAVKWFLAGNAGNYSRFPSVQTMFRTDGAIAALNSAFWQKTLAMTDIYDCMPQKRRNEWNEQIGAFKTPEYTEDAVRPTINALLADRSKFFAERVDGIFRGLSGHHVTNRPEGFSKRMIIAAVTNEWGTSTQTAGLINDLRSVIAKFMGRGELGYNESNSAINNARKYNCGEWVILDGGALKLKCYQIGTAHLEVHPDIAYRLNQVLAGLYPSAIPAQFRSKPKKALKEFTMIGRPLPFSVLSLLNGLSSHRNKAWYFATTWNYSTQLIEEASRILVSIGAERQQDGGFVFDYNPASALREIVASGCIPDRVAHQFYPTPLKIAEMAVEMAEITDTDTILEPSAGHGAIANLLPVNQTTCVEISAVHCAILEAKGFNTCKDDFINWGMLKKANGIKFDKVVMNPPYSEGRWKMHVDAAWDICTGSLTVILPASQHGKQLLDGVTTWSPLFENCFDNTSVAVAIMHVKRN